MPNFRYRALTANGEIVSGLITAPTAAEVARRIDYLRLVPIDTIVEENTARASLLTFRFERGRSEDVTIFTLDLALLLKAGARLDRGLELLATDADIGRLRPTVRAIRSSVLAGESFAEALAHHPELFPPMYVALVRVGEASGTLAEILEVVAGDRSRAEALRRKIADAVRYPAFLLFASTGVLVFFLMFVLPQLGSVLHDMGAKIDPIAGTFLQLSEFLTAHKNLIGSAAIILLAGALFLGRQPKFRAAIIRRLARLPVIRSILALQQTAMFCRNLEVLLTAAVPLTTTLRILANMMAAMGDAAVWTRVVERIRQGIKLSEALEETATLPPLAVRMLRLGEETGQLPVLAGRVAQFYETKLQRSLDRAVGIVGPLAVIFISTIVGGLIVSVMTALLSVSQSIG
ncbi:MAG: type II secretion system F family protein [Pseudolabrys sp.]|jgi:general secretion pathway protein F